MSLLIIGGGRSGQAAARLAERLSLETTVFESDVARRAELADVSVTLVDSWDQVDLSTFVMAVVSPGIPEHSPFVADVLDANVELISEIEFAWRQVSAPCVAVTGTNGKTTVTELVAAMLASSGQAVTAAGNIGVPLSEVADQQWDSLVVEVSSFQLRFISSFAPHVAVVLNVADDHLDWHGSPDAYLAAKRRIVEFQSDSDHVVFNVDDAGASAIANQVLTRAVGVSGLEARDGTDASQVYGVRGALFVTPSVTIPLADLRVNDASYLMDMAAAAVAADFLGASPDAVSETLRSFEPRRHRRTKVAEIDGVVYVNDSKATNPHAAVASILAYESVVLIAGGQNKGLDLSPLAGPSNVRHFIAIGESGPELLAERAGRFAESLEEAVKLAHSFAEPNDTVLLAPGCASFDMFINYEARGEEFEALVHALGEAS